ncbi:MAG: FAD:protein FMN transferase, partial [Lachnospiraceae bacterium]|nr:FAD:protein FMN transferase [Lachnospiraceae bacterium]
MNKTKITSVVIIVLLIVLILLAQSGRLFGNGRGSEPEMQHYTATFLDIFDTRTEIVGFATSEEEFRKQADVVKERLVYYNNLYDIYNDYEGVNNIKTINDNAGIAPVEVDEEIINLLKFSKEMYDL